MRKVHKIQHTPPETSAEKRRLKHKTAMMIKYLYIRLYGTSNTSNTRNSLSTQEYINYIHAYRELDIRINEGDFINLDVTVGKTSEMRFKFMYSSDNFLHSSVYIYNSDTAVRTIDTSTFQNDYEDDSTLFNYSTICDSSTLVQFIHIIKDLNKFMRDIERIHTMIKIFR